MGHILENLVGTILNPATLATGYRALDSLSPSVLASFWESTQAATALVERARAESLPAGDKPGAAQAKQCEELLQFALGILRYTLDLAATPKQKLANDLSASGIEPRLHDVLMRNYSPETLHLLRRVLQYNYEILHSLAESVDSPGKRHPVFVMDLNMLLNAVERLSACLPGVPNVHHAMTALPYSRQHGEDRDIMLLLRSIAGEVETWPPQTCFSEFKMLKDIRPEHETADKANDPGRDPKDTGKYLGWVWSGANDREVTALNDWQTAAWSNKILNPSQKVPKDIDPAILEDNEVSEIWFFINGVVTDHWIAQLNAEHLADVFKRPINILHNPTDGLHRDLRECVKGRTLSELTGTSERIFGELLKHVARKKTKGKIVVVAHSQGTIITADVIRKVREEHPNLLERMEVFNFAFCADQVPDCVRHLEHYVNENHSRPN